MKVKSDYIIREIAGTTVILPTGRDALDFNGVITLNKTGAFLYKILETENTERGLIEALVDRYNVEEKCAKRDVLEFVDKLREANLLE